MKITTGQILITGAAGAIGAAIARAMRMAWPEARLALLDRDAASMQPLAAELGDATVIAYDLRDVAGLAAMVESLGELDGLVNCAGVMRIQNTASWDWQEASDLLTIDLLAPLRLQDLALKQMVPNRRGLIVNIASTAARAPLRGGAYYCASKAGLAIASEIARIDVAPDGVEIITVYPGPVHSALERGARAGYDKGGGFIGRNAPIGDPAKLAAEIVKAIATGGSRVVYPRLYRSALAIPDVASWIALKLGPPPLR